MQSGLFHGYPQKERMQNNFGRSVYSANAHKICNEVTMSLRAQQMERGWKPRVLKRFDNLWMEDPFPLKAVGIHLVLSMGADPSFCRSSGAISHVSGLVKCCKSSILDARALYMGTRHWEGGKVHWPQLSPTPWQ